MGSSAKKKREKKKDFQKPKLKVGKARPKPANSTDTSFRSKAIVISQQSLSLAAPSATSQFAHHVSLLAAKSESQRKESLAYLTTSIATRPVDSPLQLPASTLLPKLCPLILDGSSGVRNQLLKGFQVLPDAEVADHASEILPYVRAGMTHLAADIRMSAVSVLAWLTRIAGNEIVSCPGGWYRTLACFLTIMGWNGEGEAKWASNKPMFAKTAVEGKPLIRNMQVLADFIAAGLDDGSDAGGMADSYQHSITFPLWDVKHHYIPEKSNAYAHLSLFGIPKDDDNAMLEAREDRLRIFDEKFRTVIELNLETAKSEGGEIGRAAALVTKALRAATSSSS
jgi:pre-rRNA-processing protein IPI1